MLRLDLLCPADRGALPTEVARVRQVFPELDVTGGWPDADTDGARVIVVPAPEWRGPSFDPLPLDDVVARERPDAEDVVLRVIDRAGTARACAAVALQVMTRYQRFLRGRNGHSRVPLFDRILALHRSLHDVRKPLVAADLDHALDTWRWALRLSAEASLALQVAALFHDVERLASESEARIEQHAADYAAFKDAHAAEGARLARAALRRVGADEPLVARVAALVATHERLDGDEEKRLLNEADALSFFSLNACGFLAYYGLAHTRRKVTYTLARLGERGRRALAEVRLRADIAALVAEGATA
jgi:hypothetical protein